MARVALTVERQAHNHKVAGFESRQFLLKSKMRQQPPIFGRAKIRRNPTKNIFKLINHLNPLFFQLKCCGAQEYLDWENTTFAENGDVPDSW